MIKKDWHKDIIYQIYPKSFLDTTGSGYGDINGIIHKIDYLKDLGITCIWLSPVFESPMRDNGYDIKDYKKIDSIFGSNEDMYQLINVAKANGIKVMLDIVVNHTSDQHYWFQEALKGKDNKYRDYYIWSDTKNDLKSIFLGDAWEYDESSKQYYFHLFAKEQPDLNWENENLREDIYEMMNFWIDKGVEGFRMDVIEFLGKQPENLITSDGPHLHNYIYEMNRNTFGVRNCITVGESWSATDETSKLYTDPNRNELSMIFRFDQITTFWDPKLGKWKLRPFNLLEFKKILFARQKKANHKYWNTLFWGSHDLPRAASYYIDPLFVEPGAKMLCAINMFMSGTPFIYQGDEIGMTNIVLKTDEYKDIEAVNALEMLKNDGYSEEEAENMIYRMSRDNARTPMQWEDDLNSGFTDGTPWIKVNEKYKEVNVKKQIGDELSTLNFYKKTISIRKDDDLLDLILYGDFSPNDEDSEELLSYTRINEKNQIKVIANFSNQEIPYDMSELNEYVLLNNYETNNKSSFLAPYQVIVLRIYPL